MLTNFPKLKKIVKIRTKIRTDWED